MGKTTNRNRGGGGLVTGKSSTERDRDADLSRSQRKKKSGRRECPLCVIAKRIVSLPFRKGRRLPPSFPSFLPSFLPSFFPPSSRIRRFEKASRRCQVSFLKLNHGSRIIVVERSKGGSFSSLESDVNLSGGRRRGR